MKADNSPARGMRDLLPSEVATRDHVLHAITSTYRTFGFQRIETPALEDINRLQGGQGGENEKLIYQVLRRGLPDRTDTETSLRELVDLGLRFDLTVPLTRFYGNNHANLPTPFRSLQIGPVWRAERPQKGRYRQFYQCDIDIIGEPSVLAETELIEATTAALAAVGLDGIVVRISDRRFLTALAHDAGLPEESWNRFFTGLDKLDKIGWEGVSAELDRMGLPSEQVEDALTRIRSLQETPAGELAKVLSAEVPSLEERVIADLAATTASLDLLASERSMKWEFDPTLVRGMGYYTGQIFEIAHPSVGSSIAGGGRYDRLIGRTLGKDIPACGFSIGFERIIELINNVPQSPSVAMLVQPEVPPAEALAAARSLRDGAQIVEVIPRSGKLGAQLKRLQANGLSAFTTVDVVDGVVTVGEVRPL